MYLTTRSGFVPWKKDIWFLIFCSRRKSIIQTAHETASFRIFQKRFMLQKRCGNIRKHIPHLIRRKSIRIFILIPAHFLFPFNGFCFLEISLPPAAGADTSTASLKAFISVFSGTSIQINIPPSILCVLHRGEPYVSIARIITSHFRARIAAVSGRVSVLSQGLLLFPTRASFCHRDCCYFRPGRHFVTWIVCIWE